MRNKIIAHFHLKRSNLGASSREAVIYLRLTVNGERAEISTNKRFNPSAWNKVTERVTSRGEASRLVNSYLKNLTNKVEKYLINDDRITTHQIICDLKGISSSTKTLFEAYENHIASIEKLSGVIYTASTVKKYKYSFNSLKRYTKDFKLTDLGYNFISGYYDYMRVTEGLLHNSAAKNIKNLFKVINVAIRNKWLSDNPFKDFSCTFINPIRHFLKEYQKHVIENTCWFSIELEWHMKPTYTEYERQQLTVVLGRFPEQEILIFGECDRIFVAAHEIILHLGGLLYVSLGHSRQTINKYPGKKIPVYKKQYSNPLKHKPDNWLVDHIFIREYFSSISGDNFEKFKLNEFLYKA